MARPDPPPLQFPPCSGSALMPWALSVWPWRCAARAPAAGQRPPGPKGGPKRAFGTVGRRAGGLGLTGAAYLSSPAAARSGAGLVRLLVAESIYPILATKCTEVMATPIAEVAPGAVGHAVYDQGLRLFKAADAAVLGPGLDRDSSTWRLVHDLAAHAACPLVIDADGLNAVAESPRTP